MAMRSGGFREISIDPVREGDPRMRISVDFTSQAMVNEGKVPPVGTGKLIDRAHETGGKKSKMKGAGASLNVQADPDNIKELQDRLAECNELARKGDPEAKREARQIRSALRSLGVKGGARRK